MIDLDQLNPDWQFAKMHGKAAMIGRTSTAQHSQKDLCPCCFNPIKKQPLPLCENTKELQILGTGIPLFYVFMKSSLLLLLVMICSYHAVSVYLAFSQNYVICLDKYHAADDSSDHSSDHSEPHCTSFMIQMARIVHHIPDIEIVLRITSFVIHLALLIYFRDMILKLQAYYDERSCTLSDYAIKLKDIPLQKGLKGKLKQFFMQGFSQPHTIKQTTFLPEYHELQHLKKQKNDKINELRPYFKDDQTIEDNRKEIKQIENEIASLKASIEEQLTNLNTKANADLLECSSVILVFNTDFQKQEIIEEYSSIDKKTLRKYFGERSEKISLEEAAEPKEIIWENMNLSKSQRVKRKLIGWGLSLLVIVVITVIFYFVIEQKTILFIQTLDNYHEDPVANEAKLKGAVALVYITLFLVILFNKLGMSVLFHKFTHLQCHKTTSSFQFSFGLKYCLGLFFTTALMTLAVEALTFGNFYTHQFGVIEEQMIMFFLNAFFVPIFWLINPFAIKNSVKRKLGFGKKDITQRQANQLMEEYEYSVGKKYAEIIETLWFTFLYASLIPMGAIISFVGLGLYFWVDKYNLLRRSTLHVHIGGKLTNLSLTLLDFTLVLRVVGELFFDGLIRDGIKTSTIVLACVAFLYMILPVSKLLMCINHEKFNLEQKTYDEVKNTFVETYHTLHPIYYASHRQRLNRKLSENLGISFKIITQHHFKTTEALDIDTM